MSQNYVILTDSSADLPLDLLRQDEIELLPLSFLLEDKIYENHPDERDITNADFYQRLRNGANVTTSAVNVDTFQQFFRTFLDQGKDILYIGFSSGLSSTYSAGVIALQELQESYPDRKLRSVDSLCASLGQGLLVHTAAQKRMEGMDIDALADWVEANKLSLCHWFTVDDLFFLKRGGRVSAATAIVGSTLGIKPVLHVDNEGHLINVAKARGRKKAMTALVDHVVSDGIDIANQTVFISHGDCIEDAKAIAKEISDRCGVKDFVFNHVGPVIGAHAGPNVLAIFFFGKER